jgi:mannose-6-phosphate isomerase
MAGSMPNFRFRTVDGRIEPMTENEPRHPRRVEKPWGYEIWWAVTDRYVGKILHVNKGERLSLQYHEQKEETCYVLSGSLLLVQGESEDSLAERVVGVGEIWHNAPGVIHTIEAVEDSDVLEASTPFLDDVVRLRDNYGREGTSAI